MDTYTIHVNLFFYTEFCRQKIEEIKNEHNSETRGKKSVRFVFDTLYQPSSRMRSDLF